MAGTSLLEDAAGAFTDHAPEIQSTSADEGKGGKRKRPRRETTLVEKIQLIHRANNGASQRHLARDFGIGLGTVNNILKKKAKTLLEAEATDTPVRKRKTRHEALNNMVWDWYKNNKNKGTISGIMVQEKALEFAKRVPHAQDFKASNGWLETFCKRHRISFRKQKQQSSLACSSAPLPIDLPEHGIEEWSEWYTSAQMTELLKLYSPDDIFTASETQLLYHTLPETAGQLLRDFKDHSLSLQEDTDVVTILLCCNATGTNKLNPLVVGSDHKVDNTVETLGMKKAPQAWMTADIFHEWLLALEADMKFQNRNILLLIPSTPCHSSDVDLQHVTVRVCPSLYLATNQMCCPLLLGVIQNFKDKFRVLLLRHALAQLKLKLTPCKVDGSLLLTWIQAAWNDIAPEKCQESYARQPIAVSDELSTLLALYYVVSPLVEPALIITPLEYITVDDHLPTQLMFTEEWSLLENRKNAEEAKPKLTMASAYQMLDSLRAFAAEKEPALLASLGHVAMAFESKIVQTMLGESALVPENPPEPPSLPEEPSEVDVSTASTAVVTQPPYPWE